MTDSLTTVIALIVLFVALPVALLRLKDRRRGARSRSTRSGAAGIAERQERERRLVDPDWTAVEGRLRRPVPEDVRRLYANHALILRGDLACGDEIISFEPLDEPAMLENSRWLGFDAVTFARNGFGDAIYLRPGADEVDRVYVTHHDGGDTEVLAESVREFVEAVRRSSVL